MNSENLDICDSEWEIVQTEEATQTSNLSIDRVLKPDKPRLPLPRNLSTVDKSANTSYNGSITVFEFQVIENPDEPGDIIIVRGTPSDDRKCSPADGKSILSDRAEIRSSYCKDIIKPFLKSDCPESEEELLNNTIDSISEDFPDYQPCEFPDSETERTRACLSLGKVDVCTSINTNKSGMENGSVEPAGTSGDTKIEVEISRVPLSCLVDAQALSQAQGLSSPGKEAKTVPPVKKPCPCSQIDQCIKPVMEICHVDDKKDGNKDNTKENTIDRNEENEKSSCVCVTVTRSSKTKCAETKSKEQIKEPNKGSNSTSDCGIKSSKELECAEKKSKEPNKETNKGSNSTPDCGIKSSKELICDEKKSKEPNKGSNSTPDCSTKSSKEPIKEKKTSKETCQDPNKESNKKSPSELDCFKKKSKESIKEPDTEPNKELPSKLDCFEKKSKESIKEPNKDPKHDGCKNVSKESTKEFNKESSSKLDCFEKKPKELIEEPNKESPSKHDGCKKLSKESSKELNKKSPSKLDCLKNKSKESIQEPNKELNRESPSKHDGCKKLSKEPSKESPPKPEGGQKASLKSITKITIECQNTLSPNVDVSTEKCSDEGPPVNGFVDALDAHTKTLTTIKVAMQDFIGKVCSSNQASDEECKPPKPVNLIERVFDVSDVDKNLLVPNISGVIKSMKLKVDSTLSMISDSIDNVMTTEGFQTASVNSDRDLDSVETQDVGNNSPSASVTMPTPVPVSNSMFYTIKDKIVSMFREPKSDISTRTSTFTNSSLESNNEADSSKKSH